jgi:hypothetical protein
MPMMKAGSSETGSLINHVYSRAQEVTPELGMGVTILCWSDRHAGTIVKITPTQLHVQRDIATRIDKNGMSECQEYTYSRDETQMPEVFRRTTKGYRNKAGNGLLVGTREKYYDYSF